MRKYGLLLGGLLLFGCSEQAEPAPPVKVEKQEIVEKEEVSDAPRENVSEERAEALKRCDPF